MELVIAPPEAIDKVASVTVPAYCRSTVPAAPMVSKPPVEPPRELGFVKAKVPALTFTGPVNRVFAFETVKVDVPVSLVKVPAPEIAPDSVCVADDEYLNVAPEAMLRFPA